MMLWNDWLSSCRLATARSRWRSTDRREARVAIEVLQPRQLLTATAVTGAIEGTVFDDVNGDAEFNAGDFGLSGWRVFVDRNENRMLDLATVQAESDAVVEIPDLGQGISTLDVSDVSGTIADVSVKIDISHTFPLDLHAFLVSPAGTRIELFQGVAGNDSDLLHGAVFEDSGLFSISDPRAQSPYDGSIRPRETLGRLFGESPNGTWKLEVNDESPEDSGTISLFQLMLSLAGPESESFAVTDDTGAYRIEGVTAGTHIVREGLQRGYLQPYPESYSQSVTVTEEETTSGVNFGVMAEPSVIYGSVWDDLNGDGFHDWLKEPGASGWTIELLDATTSEVIDSTMSGEDGRYVFQVQRPGRYLVREVLRDGYQQTAPEADTSVVGDDPIVQAGSFEVTAPPTGTAESPAPWLPDLIVDMQNPFGLRDAFLDGNTLRFGQASPNVGDGPMRLVGGPDNGDGTQQVFQRIYDDQGGYTERLAGDFAFHPAHNHIHFEGFASYSLRTALPDQDNDGMPEVGDIVRGGTKTSFCLVDVQRYATDPALPNADHDGSGFGCDTQQEISVGWEDIYGAGTEGQEINVAGLAPGDYWLEATVDPDNHFLEKNESNNTGRILIHLAPAQRAYRVTLDPGSAVHDLGFGNFQQITVTGTVFNDVNSNARRDYNERGLMHAAVFIDSNGDHILNNPTSGDGVADGLAQEPWAITDDNGHYTFTGLRPGHYQVQLVAPAGQIQTTETPRGFDAISGHDVVVNQFGVGLRPTATTLVTTANDGHIVVSDISARGQDDRLTVTVEGFPFAAGGLLPFGTPVIRVNDPGHVLTTTLGVQEGLHTVFVPLNDNILSNLVEINGWNGNDVLSVDLGASPIAVLVNGGNGNDTITISGGSHFLPLDQSNRGDLAAQIQNHDHTGEDRLDNLLDPIGFFESSTVNGGSGNDRIVGKKANLDLVLNGDDGNDSIGGGSGNDVIQGGSGNDSLSGGDGIDQFVSRGDDGIDKVDGGHGLDFVIVVGTSNGDSYTVSATGGSRVIVQRAPGTSPAIDMRGVESLQVNALEGDDRLIVRATTPIPLVIGFDTGPGNDTLQLIGSAGSDRFLIQPLYLYNEPLDPTMTVIRVSNGNDRFHFVASLGGGNDLFDAVQAPIYVQWSIHGDAGNDTIIGGLGFDSLWGGEGDDSLVGGVARDRLFGENGNDTLIGGGEDDYLDGGRGADHLEGNAGSDTISGGLDNDLLLGDDGEDFLNGDRGNDTLFGGAGDDALIGVDGNDLLDGEAGSDTLVGGNGNDQLFGGDGGDLMFGNDGNDRLDGQSGDDTLVGGTGRNSFVHPASSEIVAVFHFNLQRLLDQF